MQFKNLFSIFTIILNRFIFTDMLFICVILWYCSISFLFVYWRIVCMFSSLLHYFPALFLALGEELFWKGADNLHSCLFFLMWKSQDRPALTSSTRLFPTEIQYRVLWSSRFSESHQHLTASLTAQLTLISMQLHPQANTSFMNHSCISEIRQLQILAFNQGHLSASVWKYIRLLTTVPTFCMYSTVYIQDEAA